MTIADHARIWIFQSMRAFTKQETQDIKSEFDNFLLDWNAHGAALLAEYEIINNQFIIVTVDEDQAEASGCSIDKLTKLIKNLEEKHQFGFLDRMNVAYEVNTKIEIMNLLDFKKAVKNAELPAETIVYNNGVTTLSDFRSQWKLPLNKSWAKNLLP